MTQILPQQQAFHNFDTSSKNAVSVGPRKNVARKY